MATNIGFIVLSQGRSDMLTHCENCGQAIMRYAYIRSRATQHVMRVGLDCMKNLCSSGHTEKQLMFNF